MSQEGRSRSEEKVRKQCWEGEWSRGEGEREEE